MKRISAILKNRAYTMSKAERLPKRPREKKTRSYIDNEYYDSGYAATFPNSVTAVYGVLARHANAKDQTCFPSITIIAEKTGCMRRTVLRGLKVLEGYHIVEVARDMGNPNVYLMVDASVWLPAGSVKKDTAKGDEKLALGMSKETSEQCQKKQPSSVTRDTLSHKSESNNLNLERSYEDQGLSDFSLKLLEARYGKNYKREIIVKAALEALKSGVPKLEILLKLSPFLEKAAISI